MSEGMMDGKMERVEEQRDQLLSQSLITNRSEGESLLSALRGLISGAEGASFATAYFLASALRELREQIEELAESGGRVRILLGKEARRPTAEAVAQALHLRKVKQGEGGHFSMEGRQLRLTEAQRARLLREKAREFGRLVAADEQSDEQAEWLRRFKELLVEGVIEVRFYHARPFHPKLYLADYPGGEGKAVVGSSNLTPAGLSKNVELNLLITDQGTVRELREFFEEYWNEALYECEVWEEDSETGEQKKVTKTLNQLLIDELEQSWALYRPEPYEVYMKIAYELTRSVRLEQEELEKLPQLLEKKLPEFQLDAVIQAREILLRYGGVIIADVVGLGKTYVGATLLRDLSSRFQRSVVICPPVLKPTWDYVLDRIFGREANPPRIISLGEVRYADRREGADRAKLEAWHRLRSAIGEAEVVLIDEAHHFRNPGEGGWMDPSRKGYANLKELISNPDGSPKKLILLTATPYNTEAQNIINLIKLFLQWWIWQGEHFPQAGNGAERPVVPEVVTYYGDLDKIAEEFTRYGNKYPLVALLKALMIRRTRKHVYKYWKDKLEEFLSKNEMRGWPQRGKPRVVEYELDETYLDRLEQIEHALGELTYARFNLGKYLREEIRKDPLNKERLQRFAQAGKQLEGFMRVLLFKRLESSVEALRRTVADQIRVHRAFLKLIEQAKQGTASLLTDFADEFRKRLRTILSEAEEDQEKLKEHIADIVEEISRARGDDGYPADWFDLDSLRDDVERDAGIFERLAALLADIDREQDEKLQRLIRLVNKLLAERPGRKILIFSEYADTVEYIGEALRDGVSFPSNFLDGVDLPEGFATKAVRHISSAAKRSGIKRAAEEFAPQFNDAKRKPEEQLYVLVSTDVLSEGVNLQAADVIINYDLHWNPVKLIQRIGRIDRLGSPHEEVYVYNFLPHRKNEEILKLEERLRRRFEEMKQIVGEDQSFLAPDEKLAKTFEYFKRPYEEAVDEEDLAEDKEAAALDLYLRDLEGELKKLRQKDPDTYRRIVQMPGRVWSSMAAKVVNGEPVRPGVISFLRAQGNFYRLVKLEEPDGTIRGLNEDLRYELLKQLRCDKKEHRQKPPEDFHAKVTRIEEAFIRWVREELPRTLEAGRMKSVELIKKKLRTAKKYLLRNLGKGDSNEIKAIKREIEELVEDMLNVINYHKLNKAQLTALLRFQSRILQIQDLRELHRVVCSERDLQEASRADQGEEEIRREPVIEVICSMGLVGGDGGQSPDGEGP